MAIAPTKTVGEIAVEIPNATCEFEKLDICSRARLRWNRNRVGMTRGHGDVTS
jgi:hypothetical protein